MQYAAWEPRLLEGLSVYQDVVLAGQIVHHGQRDCAARWDLLAPWIGQPGTILDVGSNFGWFALRCCAEFPQCVVASCEADARSAAVQWHVLASHNERRVCLLTQRMTARLVRRMAAAGQQFDTALCLAVLHWMRDHREFLGELGAISGRIVLEFPHPAEQGAGCPRVQSEIGEPGEYLRSVFPHRAVHCLGEVANHRQAELPRQLWLVEPPAGWVCRAPGLHCEALWPAAPAWPRRSWWEAQLAQPLRESPAEHAAALAFTGAGLQGGGAAEHPRAERRVRRLAEDGPFTPRQRFRRRARRWGGALLRRLRLRV